MKCIRSYAFSITFCLDHKSIYALLFYGKFIPKLSWKKIKIVVDELFLTDHVTVRNLLLEIVAHAIL